MKKTIIIILTFTAVSHCIAMQYAPEGLRDMCLNNQSEACKRLQRYFHCAYMLNSVPHNQLTTDKSYCDTIYINSEESRSTGLPSSRQLSDVIDVLVIQNNKSPEKKAEYVEEAKKRLLYLYYKELCDKKKYIEKSR